MKKIISAFLLCILSCFMLISSTSALNWDGDSAGGSTNAVNGSSKGYVIRSVIDEKCVVGYRFSLMNEAGNMKLNKVIDIYRNTSNGNSAYSSSAKFSVKYNKKGIRLNKNAILSTTMNTTNCYLEKNMSFLTPLPDPAGVEKWQMYENNINVVLAKLGAGSVSNLLYGDKIIIEPLFDICLAGEYQALTVSEIAYCGRSILSGDSDGGKSNGTSSTWGFIANYTNRIWPNKLYTPDGQGLFESASEIPDDTKVSFDTILNKGYGVGIAYTEKGNISYTIKFNGNGSTSGTMNNISVIGDKSVTLTANSFKKTGHSFLSWNTKSDGTGTNYPDKATVKSLTKKNGATVNLYAQWKANTLTIAYSCEGSDVKVIDKSKGYALSTKNRIVFSSDSGKEIDGTKNVYTKTLKYNSEIGTNGLHDFATFGLSAPEGYEFTSWTNGVTDFDEKAENYKATDFSSGIKTGNVTVWLKAKFAPIKYTVKFNGNGAVTGTMASKSMTYDKASPLTLNAFSRSFTVKYDYGIEGVSLKTVKAVSAFTGWALTPTGTKKYDDGATVKNLSTTPATVNLYALWSDKAVTLPTPEKEGYIFKGWYLTENGVTTKVGNGGDKYVPTKNVTLTARYSPISYTLRFFLDGNELKEKEIIVNYDKAFTFPSLPVNLNDNISGWFDGPNEESSKRYEENSSHKNLTTINKTVLSFYAFTKENSYTVIYEENGKELPDKTQVCSFGKEYKTHFLPRKTGYISDGWYMGEEKKEENSSFINLASAPGEKIYLKCNTGPCMYSVSYIGNGATAGFMEDSNHIYDILSSLSANSFEREFKVKYVYENGLVSDKTVKATSLFTGWSKTKDGEALFPDKCNILNLTTVNGYKINLFACWSDGALKLPAAAKTGYIFEGWADEDGNLVGGPGDNFTPQRDITLHGLWRPIQYTVVFDGNGATSGSTERKIFTYDKKDSLPENGFKKEGYIFESWNTNKTGTGKSFSDKEEVLNLSSTDGDTVTLYAQYVKKEITPSLYLRHVKFNDPYRENTDVYTTFEIRNETDISYTPDMGLSIKFTIKNGSEILHTFVSDEVIVPAKDKNIIYFSWHVPENLNTDRISVTGELFEKGTKIYTHTGYYPVIPYIFNVTPDTSYEYSAPESFSVPAKPSEEKEDLSYTEYVYENGKFTKKTYAFTSPDATAVITPAASSGSTQNTIRSGYGINISVNTSPTSGPCTGPGYVYASFPEFSYEEGANTTRTLKEENGKWFIPENSYGKIHFTPLWYPDGPYSIYVTVSDIWTPAGMLKTKTNSNPLTISGSIYDDWTIN